MRFGVDEAGKGPVLGSMFAACVRGDPGGLPDGVADSKRLAPARREEIAAAVRDRFDVGVAEVTPARIDGEEDVNALVVTAHADAIRAVVREGDGGTCDACDTSEERFARRVARASGVADVAAEHGAEDADPLVAAASVVAKVEREAHVATLAATYGEVGSGYPSDPTTRAFLREWVRDHGSLPPCARASWSTAGDVLASAEQSALDEF